MLTADATNSLTALLMVGFDEMNPKMDAGVREGMQLFSQKVAENVVAWLNGYVRVSTDVQDDTYTGVFRDV